MTAQPPSTTNTGDWEDVLYAYLEGRAARADAEDLLLRLHLTADEREEIERSLRLADEVTAAVRAPAPSASFEARLSTAIRDCPVPANLPQGWTRAGDQFVVRALGGVVAPGDVDAEQSEPPRQCAEMDVQKEPRRIGRRRLRTFRRYEGNHGA